MACVSPRNHLDFAPYCKDIDYTEFFIDVCARYTHDQCEKFLHFLHEYKSLTKKFNKNFTKNNNFNAIKAFEATIKHNNFQIFYDFIDKITNKSKKNEHFKFIEFNLSHDEIWRYIIDTYKQKKYAMCYCLLVTLNNTITSQHYYIGNENKINIGNILVLMLLYNEDKDIDNTSELLQLIYEDIQYMYKTNSEHRFCMCDFHTQSKSHTEYTNCKLHDFLQYIFLIICRVCYDLCREKYLCKMNRMKQFLDFAYDNNIIINMDRKITYLPIDSFSHIDDKQKSDICPFDVACYCTLNFAEILYNYSKRINNVKALINNLNECLYFTFESQNMNIVKLVIEIYQQCEYDINLFAEYNAIYNLVKCDVHFVIDFLKFMKTKNVFISDTESMLDLIIEQNQKKDMLQLFHYYLLYCEDNKLNVDLTNCVKGLKFYFSLNDENIELIFDAKSTLKEYISAKYPNICAEIFS